MKKIFFNLNNSNRIYVKWFGNVKSQKQIIIIINRKLKYANSPRKIE